MRNRGPDNFFPLFLRFLSVFVCVHLWFLCLPALAQESSDQEVAVNLAEGRVVVCATKDGVIVAAIGAPVAGSPGEAGEPGSHPPAIAILSSERVGVMMGAVEWVRPDSSDKPIRLDAEFRGLVAAALNTGGQARGSESAGDIETIGVSVLERLRQVAGLLHHKVNLGEDEPVVRIVLTGFVPNYGPEVWTIDYRIQQDALGNGVWRTRVLRPRYDQLYPPEKGRPHTLMEIRYPPENRASGAPELLDLLQQNDPRLQKIRDAAPAVANSVSAVVEGRSQKSESASMINFFKAALPAVTPPDTKLAMALVDFDRGFQWIVQPQEAPPPPPSEGPNEQTPEEPERPSLRRKSEGGPR